MNKKHSLKENLGRIKSKLGSGIAKFNERLMAVAKPSFVVLGALSPIFGAMGLTAALASSETLCEITPLAIKAIGGAALSVGSVVLMIPAGCFFNRLAFGLPTPSKPAETINQQQSP